MAEWGSLSGDDLQEYTMTGTGENLNVVNTVVRNDFCCSCGVCAAICPKNTLRMRENKRGIVQPREHGACAESCRLCLQICPFSNETKENEDSLGYSLYGPDSSLSHHPSLGFIRDSFVGGVVDEGLRKQAPSGGLTTALLSEMLTQGMVQSAIVPQPLAKRPWYQFQLVNSREALLASQGSVYHCLSLDSVVSEIIRGPEQKYAIVGVPCAVKALRLAQKRSALLKRRIPYIFGLACGGYRSLYFADLMTSLLRGDSGTLRYRSKATARNARDYSVEFLTEGSRRSLRMLGLYGFLWINEVGMLHSCLFCDDIFAELADATLMDAWLPEYISDPRGTNLMISRSGAVTRLFEKLCENGICKGKHISPERVELSQWEQLAGRRARLRERYEFAQGSRTCVPIKRFALAEVHARSRKQADAVRELKFYYCIQDKLAKWRSSVMSSSPRRAFWSALRFCGRIAICAARHRQLHRTLNASRHVRDKMLRASR